MARHGAHVSQQGERCDHVPPHNVVWVTENQSRSMRVAIMKEKGCVTEGLCMCGEMSTVQGEVVDIRTTKCSNVVETPKRKERRGSWCIVVSISGWVGLNFDATTAL